MRWLKWALVYAACFAAVAAVAQVHQIPSWPPNFVPSGGGGTPFTTNCSQSNTFLNTKVGGQGHGMSTTIAAFYDTMICGLVSDGDWSHLDALYIQAAPTQTIAQYNLTTSATTHDLVAHGTGTFTANSNYAGNGTTGYLDTQFNPSTAGGNYANTSASYGVYILSDTAGALAVEMGAYDGTNLAQLLALYTSNSPLIYLNSNSNSVGPNTSVHSNGLYFVELAGGVLTGYVYRPSCSPCTAAQSQGSGTSPNATFYIDARNNANTADTFSSRQIAASYIGDGTVVAAHMSSRINAFMTSQGINVY